MKKQSTCGKCGFEHESSVNFCTNCGAALREACPGCGAKISAGARFCGRCGHELQRTDTASSDAALGKAPPEAGGDKVSERRQLTVMFSDLVDSTALASKLDPEELQDVLRAYQEVSSEVIEDLDGYIAHYLGDGIIAFFGYPQAHEDEAVRAVKAGLRILDVLDNLNLDLRKSRGFDIAARVGIHTGLTVVGDINVHLKKETLAFGDTPAIAFRIQSEAAPGTVALSRETFKLIEHLYDFKPLGKRELKGVPGKTELYEVVRGSEKTGARDFKTKPYGALYVGRRSETELLRERWERTKESQGQVVMITGEPGIGKSRLKDYFKEIISDDDFIRTESYCSQYYTNSALYPEVEALKKTFGLNDEDTTEEKLHKAYTYLSAFGLNDNLPIFARALSTEPEDTAGSLDIPPQLLKRKTLESLIRLLHSQAESKPVLKVVEDIQWADPSTIEYLTLLIEQIAEARIMLFLIFRPAFKPPWQSHSYITHITLNRLTRKQALELVNGIAGKHPVSAETIKDIMDRADGVPLFLEEITKMVIDTSDLGQRGESKVSKSNGGEGKAPKIEIPSTLQNLLMARIDRYPEHKSIVRMGAAIGRAFSYELLRAVSKADDAQLVPGLTKFVQAEILYEKGVPPYSNYHFKHALTQKAAYESMLKKDRKNYHRLIGETLERDFPETSRTEPEILAHHFTEAGEIDKAVSYLLKAGDSATLRSAHLEGIGHLRKALSILLTESPSKGRDHKELEILSALGGQLRVTTGFASKGVEDNYRRARELVEESEMGPEQFSILRGISGFYLAKAELDTAELLARQCLEIAQESGEDSYLIQANYLLSGISFCQGRFESTVAYGEKAMSLYRPETHGANPYYYGQDPGVGCLYWMSCSLWFSGFPQSSLGKVEEAIALAERLSNAYAKSITLVLAAKIHQLRCEPQEAQKYAQESIALSSKHNFKLFLTMGNVIRGWSLVEQGQAEEGLLELREGLSEWKETGTEMFYHHWLGLLSDSYSKAGSIDDAISTVDKAIHITSKNKEAFYLSELHRLKGEYTAGDKAAAESSFRKAIEVAHAQGAKSLELRASLSLAKLLDGDKVVLNSLADIYNGFTEGNDTKDLKEAREFLSSHNLSLKEKAL